MDDSYSPAGLEMQAVIPQRREFLPFSPPSIGPDEIAAVVDALRSGWLTTGPKTREFEKRFAEFVGTRSALALNSCTAGLHSALVALGIGPRHEVITTPMTFAASVNVIEHVGAKPVLVDVDPVTLNLDPRHVERAVTSRTRAILPVHFAGHPVDLDSINAIAAARNIAVVEDAAHAIGAKYRGQWIGCGENLTSFSFYATKNMTTGEGGMLTGNAELVSQARVISLHGLTRDALRRYEQGGSWKYDVVLPGFKYNMTDIQAALGLCQLSRLPTFQNRRRQIAQAYENAFASLPEIETPVARPEVTHAWHLYVVRLRLDRLSIGRGRFIRELASRNIGTSVHFIPIHRHPYYRERYGFKRMDFPMAYRNYRRMLSLPLNPTMTDQDVADVIEALYDVVRCSRRSRSAA